jgi:hypothetical protein
LLKHLYHFDGRRLNDTTEKLELSKSQSNAGTVLVDTAKFCKSKQTWLLEAIPGPL